jgi:hypothetical protein
MKEKLYTKPKKTTSNRPRTDQQHQDPKTHESSSSPKANPTRPKDTRVKTLGIVGTPHEESIAIILSTQTCQIKRNRRNPAKKSSNPRTPKTPKSSPLTHEFWRGIKDKRTMKGSHIFPPSNPQEQGPENTPRKPPKEGSENHYQKQLGTTQHNLEEPCRIIYTYQGGSYKV